MARRCTGTRTAWGGPDSAVIAKSSGFNSNQQTDGNSRQVSTNHRTAEFGRRPRACKKKVSRGKRIGNPHLKWAFGEAACLLLRASEQAKKWLARKERKSGKARALGALSAKLGRAVYHLLRKKEAFDVKRFFAS